MPGFICRRFIVELSPVHHDVNNFDAHAHYSGLSRRRHLFIGINIFALSDDDAVITQHLLRNII